MIGSSVIDLEKKEVLSSATAKLKSHNMKMYQRMFQQNNKLLRFYSNSILVSGFSEQIFTFSPTLEQVITNHLH